MITELKKYSYMGISKDFFKTSGCFSAKNLTEVEDAMKIMLIKPIIIRECWFSLGVNSNKKIYLWFSNLHLLLSNGIRLENALITASKVSRYSIGDKIISLIESGIGFDKAIILHSFCFGGLCGSIVEALNGCIKVEELCLFLGEYHKKLYQQNEEFWGKISYPLFTMFFCIVISMLALIFVNNEFGEFIDQRGMSFSILFQIINGATKQKIILGLMLFLPTLYKIKWIFVEIPFIKDYFVNKDISIGFYCFAKAMQNGFNILNGIDVAIKACQMKQNIKIFLKIKNSLLDGNSLNKSMLDCNFDLEYCNLVEIGEESGNIHKILENISEISSQKGDKKIDFLKNYLPPLIIIFTGILVLNLFISITSTIYGAIEF